MPPFARQIGAPRQQPKYLDRLWPPFAVHAIPQETEARDFSQEKPEAQLFQRKFLLHHSCRNH